MGGAHGFAFAATQAIFHTVGNGANVRLLHDERFVAHQTKARGVGIGQIGLDVHAFWALDTAHQLAFVETPFRVDALLVIGKWLQFCIA